MARYKQTEADYGQGLFLTVKLENQLIPGTFEYMLNEIIGTKIDVSTFDENYKNDKTGAKAIPPEKLLKLIMFGYKKGVDSSRKLMGLAEENLVAKALTGDMEVHWTTIACFITVNRKKVEEVFTKVLMFSGELDLIEGEELATDGLRLPSNASVDMSGTKEELEKSLRKYRKMAEKHVKKHMKRDKLGKDLREDTEKYEKRQKILNRKIENISSFLEVMEPKKGKRIEEIKSNVTDNESAMIHTKGGYIQGYIGIATVDRKNQIIVNAQAFGTANEGEHQPKLIRDTLDNLEKAGINITKEKKPIFMQDANYFSEENLKACEELGVEAITPDSQYHRREGENKERRLEAGDFEYHEDGNFYRCPNGKTLEFKRLCAIGGEQAAMYMASVKDCRECPLNSRCIRTKKDISRWDRGRQIAIMKSNDPKSHCAKMRQKLSTEEYQELYAYRIQIVEPVFANMKNCMGLKRFTLRGNEKVNVQWKLYCIVHNLGKCLNEYNKRKGYEKVPVRKKKTA